MGYIYIITSPSGKSYIGQTTRSIQKRFRDHQEGSNCAAIYNAIQKYGWDNLEKDWYECPDEDLNFDEELLVREMMTLKPDGYNLREGGGSRGKHNKESIQKCKETKLGEKNPMFGKITSESTKQKQRESATGRAHTKTAKQKCREAKLGEKNPMYGKTGEKSHSSKKVYQYDLEGNLIRSFGSVGEASRHLKKNSHSLISMCASGSGNGRCKTAYGFKWSYTYLV
jgi:group I intron endonuclease